MNHYLSAKKMFSMSWILDIKIFLYIIFIYIFNFFLPFFEIIFYICSWIIMQFPLAHKLISSYKTVGCLIVHHCVWKTTAGENWHITEKTQSMSDILSSEVGGWAKTVENPCQTKRVYIDIYRSYSLPRSSGYFKNAAYKECTLNSS